jgi:WD40 repeat protein
MRRLAKRQTMGVRRMGAHPHLPYYLSGAQDGSVRLWEWGHPQCIAVARQPGSFPKVSKVMFNAQGNKFGVSDGEGSMCLWQVGLGVNMNRPYLNLKCHNKSMSEFTFVGSASLLATAGHSSEGRNVALWDTLLPQKNALVQGFSCHGDGASAVLYSAKHQVLISGGKRGDIAIFDVRQRQLRHTFQGHDVAIRCMSLDPAEEFFVSGSADGDIKVWALNIHSQVYSFPAEHSKNSIFRNMGSGVTQLHMSQDNHLFSCGADGSMKVRTLPDRDSVVNTWC